MTFSDNLRLLYFLFLLSLGLLFWCAEQPIELILPLSLLFNQLFDLGFLWACVNFYVFYEIILEIAVSINIPVMALNKNKPGLSLGRRFNLLMGCEACPMLNRLYKQIPFNLLDKLVKLLFFKVHVFFNVFIVLNIIFYSIISI